jgi:hypothetical protein
VEGIVEGLGVAAVVVVSVVPLVDSAERLISVTAGISVSCFNLAHDEKSAKAELVMDGWDRELIDIEKATKSHFCGGLFFGGALYIPKEAHFFFSLPLLPFFPPTFFFSLALALLVLLPTAGSSPLKK